jgi:hypothetical protein
VKKCNTNPTILQKSNGRRTKTAKLKKENRKLKGLTKTNEKINVTRQTC